MRIKDLSESVPSGIVGLVKAITMSLSSNGQNKLSTDSIRNEIKQRFNVDISYSDLMNILTGLPYVTDSNSSSVDISGQSEPDLPEQGSDQESSADKVADMATKGAHAEKS